MALRTTELTLTKGAYSVTIYATSIRDTLSNKLFSITPPTGTSKQDSGPKSNKIVDLLRINRKFTIKGFVLNATDKSNLVAIFKGAQQKGGEATLSYPDGGDGTSYSVYIESADITQKSDDEPDEGTAPDDYARYEVDLSLVEGIVI
jgi:hypothetical protein